MTPSPQAAALVLPGLSNARIAPYRAATKSDTEALALYRWNMQLAGELHQTLALAEVVLRNALDPQLKEWNVRQPPTRGITYTEEWVKHPSSPLWGILNPKIRGSNRRHSAYETAFGRAEQDRDLRDPAHPRRGIEVTHDDVVAHLTFGTWNALLPKQYPNGKLGPAPQRVLGEQALRHAFPGHPDPAVVKFWVDRLHRLRNRVSHLEPLIRTDVPSYHRTAARLLRAIDSNIGDWYSGTSNLTTVWNNRPN